MNTAIGRTGKSEGGQAAYISVLVMSQKDAAASLNSDEFKRSQPAADRVRFSARIFALALVPGDAIWLMNGRVFPPAISFFGCFAIMVQLSRPLHELSLERRF